MKNPREYTLGEIETLVTVCQLSPTVQQETLIAIGTLARCVEQVMKEQRNYRVQKVVEEIKKPKPLSHRKGISYDEELLNSCVITGL